jgi:hypothetical protein
LTQRQGDKVRGDKVRGDKARGDKAMRDLDKTNIFSEMKFYKAVDR